MLCNDCCADNVLSTTYLKTPSDAISSNSPRSAMEDIDFLENPSQDDWNQCVNLCYNHDHWGLAYSDWAAWKRGFPDGVNVFYAKTKSANEVVGFCCVSTMNSLDGKDEITNIGCFFVHPEFRSIGIGSKLFESSIGPKREEQKNITIIAGSMSDKYDARYGFNKYFDFGYEPFSIPMNDLNEAALEEEWTHYAAALKERKIAIVDVSEVDNERIVEFDEQIVQFNRRAFVSAWLRREDSYSKVAIDESTGKVVGYASLRSGCGKQLMFSPIFADTEEIAFGLVLAAMKSVSALKSHESLFFSPPSTNNSIKELIRKLSNGKFQMEDEKFVRRQFTQKAPPVDEQKIYTFTLYGLVFV